MFLQDCLLQWLQHSGKETCELCNYKFKFMPVYVENAPARVSTRQVFARCIRKSILEWLPFCLRLILAAFLWLGVVPCTTRSVRNPTLSLNAEVACELRVTGQVALARPLGQLIRHL